MFRAGGHANGRKTFCQSRLGAKIAFVRYFGLRIQVTHLIGARADAVTTANAARTVDTNDPFLIAPRRTGRANLNAGRIIAVLAGVTEVVIQRLVVII